MICVVLDYYLGKHMIKKLVFRENDKKNCIQGEQFNVMKDADCIFSFLPTFCSSHFKCFRSETAKIDVSAC